MKNGRCPRCNSTNIFCNSNGIDYGGDSYTIELWIGSSDDRLNRQSDFMSYVCVDCGHFENYILDRNILREIREKWNKA